MTVGHFLFYKMPAENYNVSNPKLTSLGIDSSCVVLLECPVGPLAAAAAAVGVDDVAAKGVVRAAAAATEGEAAAVAPRCIIVGCRNDPYRLDSCAACNLAS